MKIGSLYQINKYYWFLYTSKYYISGPTFTNNINSAEHSCNYWNISYIGPKSIFMLLKQDEICCKVLTNNGEVGWISIECKNHIDVVVN